jgi:hypothetical protein
MKTKAIRMPAAVLSGELWALKSQIAKRISATKSIRAKSEYVLVILAGSILSLLYAFFANLFHLKEPCCKGCLLL